MKISVLGIDLATESFDSTHSAATVQVIKLEQPENENLIETIPNDGFSGNFYRPMPKLPNPLVTSSSSESCSITEISDEPPSKKIASTSYGTGQMHVINVFEETDKLPKRPKKKKVDGGDAIHCSHCRLKFV